MSSVSLSLDEGFASENIGSRLLERTVMLDSFRQNTRKDVANFSVFTFGACSEDLRVEARCLQPIPSYSNFPQM